MHPNRSTIAGHPQLSSVASFLTDVDDVVDPSLPSSKTDSKKSALLWQESDRSYSGEIPMNSVKQMFQYSKTHSNESSSRLYMSSMSADSHVSSSSSSSESECRSQVSNKKPLVAPALHLKSGPGPVRVNSSSNIRTLHESSHSLVGSGAARAGSSHNLIGTNMFRSAAHHMLSRHSTIEIDDDVVHTMSDSDLLPQIHECKHEDGNYDGEGDSDEEESWWKIKCDSPIATLGRGRNETLPVKHDGDGGDDGGDDGDDDKKEKRKKSSDTSMSSLTEFTADSQFTRALPMKPTSTNSPPAKQDDNISELSRSRKKQGRASLLQNPFAMAPPKLSRRTPVKDTSPQMSGISAPPSLRKQSPSDDRTHVSSLSVTSHSHQRTPPKQLPEPKDGSSFVAPSFFQEVEHSKHSPPETPLSPQINPRHDSSRVNRLADLIHPGSPLSKYVLSVFASPSVKGTPSAPLPKKPETPLSRQSKQSSANGKSVKGSPPLPPSYENSPYASTSGKSGKGSPALPPSHETSPYAGRKASTTTKWLHEAPSTTISMHASNKGFFASHDEDDEKGGGDSCELNASNLSQIGSQHTPRSLLRDDHNDEVKSNESSPLTCDEEVTSSLNVSGTPRANFPAKRRPPSRKHTHMEDNIVETLHVVTLSLDGDYNHGSKSSIQSPLKPLPVKDVLPHQPVSSPALAVEAPASASPPRKRWGMFSSKKDTHSPVEPSAPAHVHVEETHKEMTRPAPKILPPRQASCADSNPFAALLMTPRPTEACQPSDSFVDNNDENHKIDPNSPTASSRMNASNKKTTRIGAPSHAQSKGLARDVSTSNMVVKKPPAGPSNPSTLRDESPMKKTKSHKVIHTQTSATGEAKAKKVAKAREDKEKYDNPFLKALG
jgi:hypothetical protein